MRRCKLLFVSVTAACLSVLSVPGVQAQTTDALGTYSPFSLYGVGQLDMQGTATNVMMGGIGIGVRDVRYINSVNPAAITARDSLAFMMDFGAYQKNMYLSDSRTTAAYNVFNMQNITLNLPITRKNSAFIVGISPFSNVGYKFLTKETDTALQASYGDISYQKYGTGGIYQVFAGIGWTFFDRVSLGAQGIYYFGKIEHRSNAIFSNTSMSSIMTGWQYKVHCFSGKFGLQYEQPIKKLRSSLTFGATYRLGNDMNGDVYRYAYTSKDTIRHELNNSLRPRIASELGFGLSWRMPKWMIGFDYTQQDWNKSTFKEYESEVEFQPSLAQSFRLGAELTPNRNDVRYYMKRVTYRVGGYYDRSYISLNDNQVVSYGVTFGASFPIYKLLNAFSVAVEVGQRGTLEADLIRETYVNFIFNVNLYDIWFMKYFYD